MLRSRLGKRENVVDERQHILILFVAEVFGDGEPGSLLDAFHRGEVHLFSRTFLDDIPKRLAGPGRSRFVIQPLIAAILGILNGLTDALGGAPLYLYGVLFH